MDQRTVRIFISSPADVAEERQKAQQVISDLARRYAPRLALAPILWEELPLMADTPFQKGIETVLDAKGGIDIAVFILWSRLGSPLGKKMCKPDGSPYRSGTEREWELMLAARSESARQSVPGEARPKIMAYVRNDEAGFMHSLQAQGLRGDGLEDALQQFNLARQFVREQFHDAESGTNVGAYTEFGEPLTFAGRLRLHLRNLLDAMLPDAGPPVWDRAPYQGLEAFDVEHAAIFCGREREVCELDERFRARAKAGCPFVLLVGASGSGKSSLARAGWMHYLLHESLDASVARWLPMVLTPAQAVGGDLAGLLARRVADVLPALRDAEGLNALSRALRESPQQAWELSIRRALREIDAKGSTRLVLLVDQLEEVFTDPAITAGEADCFLQALGVLVRTGQLWCLATVRSDFYDRCLQTPALVELKGACSTAFRRNGNEIPAKAGTTSAIPAEAGTTNVEGQMDLLPPDAGALQRIISRPAAFAGLRFEAAPSGETLDARILADAAAHPDALPLLQYLLRELFESRQSDGQLTLTEYAKLGGVEGALGRRAKTVFAQQDAARQAALPELLNALVTITDDDKGVPLRRRARLDELPDGPCRELAAALVNERLLVSDRGEISVAHEALLRRWERAAEWIRENREALRIRARVDQAAGSWQAEGQADDFLLPPGKPLAEAVALWTARPRMLAAESQEYVRRSHDRQQRAERRARRRLQITAAVFAALSLLAAGAAVFSAAQWRIAKTNAKRADDNAIDAEEKAAAARQAEKLAESNAETARAQARLSLQIINSVIFDIQQGLRDVPGTLAVRRNLLKLAIDGLNQVARFSQGGQVDRDMAAALTETGDVLVRLGGSQSNAVSTARQFYEQAEAMFRKLAVANPSDARAQTDLSLACLKLGAVALQSGQPDAALKFNQSAFTIAKKLADADPRDTLRQQDLALCYKRLGDAQLRLSKSDAALGNYQNALAIARRLAESSPADMDLQRKLSFACNSLGDITFQLGQTAVALRHYQEGMAIAKKLAAANVDDARDQRELTVSQQNIGDIELRQGRAADALKLYQDSLATCRKLAAVSPHDSQARRDLSVAHNHVADAQWELNQPADALKSYQDAAAIRETAVAADPGDAQGQRDLSVSYERLGDLTLQLGLIESARKYYQDCLAIRQKLAEAGPSDVQAQRNVAIVLDDLANAALRQGQTDAAQKDYQQSLAIRRKLAAADPNDAQAQRDVAVSLNRLGDAALRLGQPDAALKDFQDGLAICRKLAQIDPRDAQAQEDLTVSFIKLGSAKMQAVQPEAAMKYFQDGLEIAKRLLSANPKSSGAQARIRMFAIQISMCGDAIVALGSLDRINSQPVVNKAWLLYVRCKMLARQGDLPRVAEAAGKLRSLAGKDADILYFAAAGFSLCTRILQTPPLGGVFLPDAKPRELTAEQKAQRQKYVDLALGALKDAVAAGYHDANRMRTDDDLTALRGLPEFQKIVESIAAKGK